MADTTNTSDSTVLGNEPANANTASTINTESLNQLNDAVKKTNDLVDGFKEGTKNSDKWGKSVRDIGDMLSSNANHLSKTRDEYKNVNNEAGKLSNTFSAMMSGDMNFFSDFANSAQGAFKDVADVALEAGNSIAKTLMGSKEVVGAAGAMIGTNFMEKLKTSIYTTKIPGLGKSFNDVQKAIVDAEAPALKLGIAYSGSFEESARAVNSFRSALAESMETTRASDRELQNIVESLGEFIDASKATATLNALTGSITGINAALNTTNIAYLTASATGTNYFKVAELLGKASTELGESLESAPLILGQIAKAADGTGISFGKAADAISQGADALKMWGGTVGSVSPLFNAFANSLKGIGRVGLTPELLRTFVSGLSNMSLSARALVGLQAPGGGGGARGPLGAGLEMEQAFEEGGKGIEKITTNLIASLKNFSGGRILSRQEVTRPGADPALQQNFILQRQLLGQLTGISDTAQQTKILGVLQSIEKTGLQPQGTGTDELQKLLGAGQKVQEATTTDLVKAELDVKAAVLSSGTQIISAIKGSLTGTQLQAGLSGVEKAIQESAAKGGIDNNALDLIKDGFNQNKDKGNIQSGIKQQQINKEKPDFAKEAEDVLKSLMPSAGKKPETGELQKELDSIQKAQIEVIKRFMPKQDATRLTELQTKQQRAKTKGEDIDDKDKNEMHSLLIKGNDISTAISSAKKKAESQLEQNFGELKITDPKKYARMLDEQIASNVSEFISELKNSKNPEKTKDLQQGLTGYFKENKKEDRVALEQGDLTKSMRDDLNKRGGKGFSDRVSEQLQSQMGAQRTARGRYIDNTVGSNATRVAALNPIETKKTQKEKQEYEVGVSVKIVNDVVRVDKEYIKKVVSTMHRQEQK